MTGWLNDWIWNILKIEDNVVLLFTVMSVYS